MSEFRKCSVCGYTRGFHISFRKEDAGIKIIFICPECGASFDLNLFENRIDEIEPEKGKYY